jgi:hypothetical protein
MSKFYTRRNATILNIAGWVFTLAAWFTPRPWDSITAVVAVLAFGLAIHIRSYLDGYDKGHSDKLKVEINRVWMSEPPLPPSPLVADLHKALAADKAEARDVEWGTDYWGETLSEPTEERARELAKESGCNLYSRQPHCSWTPESLTAADKAGVPDFTTKTFREGAAK